MMNASVQGTNGSESTTDLASKWKRFAGNRSTPMQSADSFLFDSLFTSDFFRCKLPMATDPSPITPSAAPLPEENPSLANSDEVDELKSDPEEQQDKSEESSSCDQEQAMLALFCGTNVKLEPSAAPNDQTEVEQTACVEPCWHKPADTSTADLPKTNSADGTSVDATNKTRVKSDAAVDQPVADEAYQVTDNLHPVVETQVQSLQKQTSKAEVVDKRKRPNGNKDDVSGNTQVTEVTAAKQETDLQSERLPIESKERVDDSDSKQVSFDAQDRASVAASFQQPLTNPAETSSEKGPSRRAERLEARRRSSEDEGVLSTTNETETTIGIEPQAQASEVAPTSTSQPTTILETNVSSVLPQPIANVVVSPPSPIPSTPIPTTSTQKLGSTNALKVEGVSNPILPAPQQSAATANAAATPVAPRSTQQAPKSSESTVGYSSVERTKNEQTLTEYQQSRLLQRVLKGLEKFSDGSSSIRLRLHPAELGAMEVSLAMSQQRLTATIAVESEGARMILQENLPQLQSKLAEQGIVVEKVEFQTQTINESQRSSDYFGQSNGNSGQSSSNHESRQGRQLGEIRWNQIRDSVINEIVPQATHETSRNNWSTNANINLTA